MPDFIQSQIKGLRRSSARMPKPAECMIVTRLAARSIAAEAGVSAKDFLAALDGKPATDFVPQLYAYRATERSYTFYARGRHELVELATSGIEIGVEVKPTPDAIKAHFKPEEPDHKALESLWEARDWTSLGELTGAVLRHLRNRGTPVLVFNGAALFETGRQDEAMKLINEYAGKVAPGWTMNFTAVSLYYLGMDKLRRGDRDAARQLLEQAYEQNAFDRIARALEKLTGQRPPKPAPLWREKRFPVQYDLPTLEETPARRVSLAQTLDAMPERKLLIVCLLANYRGNGPYADFMLRYHNFATYFSPFLHGLHVLTAEATRRHDRDWYYKTEDQVRAAGLPVTVLHEADAAVTLAVMPTGSPFILILDRDGDVAYEGELESVDFWETLARKALV